jgi:hypothetical protein
MPYPVGLHLSLQLPTPKIRSGSMFNPTVLVTETGPSTFSMDTGRPIQAVIVRTDTRQVVGVYGGAIGGTGYLVDLSAGQSRSIPVVGGTARCDGGIGSALPVGSYQAIAQVTPETSPHAPAYLTSPVAVRVRP